MKTVRAITMLALLAACLAPLSAAERKPAEDAKTGLDVGEKAPAFTLTDQNGEQRSLEGLLEAGPVALVFTRSAEWWPFCIRQLVQLQADQAKFEEAGLQVVAVSYDAVAVLKRFAQARSITFPMLSDEGSRTIDAYGIRNREVPGGTRYDGIPYPGTFLVGTDGVIRGKVFLDGYVERHDNDELIRLAGEVLE